MVESGVRSGLRALVVDGEMQEMGKWRNGKGVGYGRCVWIEVGYTSPRIGDCVVAEDEGAMAMQAQ